MSGRLVLLVTSARVAPGLLTWPAWLALRAADEVWLDADSPLRPSLERAGCAVRPLPVEAAPDPRAFVTSRAATAAVVWPVPPEAVRPGDAVVEGSVDLPGARLLDLVAVMDRLRSPGGCPWDAEQTHASLVPYLLEEAYETVEAVEAGAADALREELGDLLLQVVFHARIGTEDPDRPWGIDDVAAGIVTKLVARHPHVFGAADALSPAQVEQRWAGLKRAEKGRESAVDGVPLAQPALALAATLMARAERERVVVAVPDVALPAGDEVSAEQVGEALLALVARARRAGVDPEAALREAARGFAGRVRAAEAAPGPPAGGR